MSDVAPLWQLHVRALGVARGGIDILQNVDFDMSKGEALILRGPNGSGKTTLLRTIAGLQPPRGGTVDTPRDDLVYSGHADGVKPTLSVAENLTFWAQVFGQGDISAALAAFDLGPLAERSAGSLSAGQKRRLGLARLLVTGRRLWVLDEPTVSLDAASVAMFADVVTAHLTTGGAALIATHIDLGLPMARVLDIGPLRAKTPAVDDFDEAFL